MGVMRQMNRDSFSRNPVTSGWRRQHGGLTALAVACTLAMAGNLRATDISPGFDLWVTPDGSSYDANGLPAGLFTCAANGDPSLAFSGTMNLKGQPLTTNPPNAISPADTVVRRGGASPLNCGDTTTMDIELVALSLVSSAPITIDCSGGGSEQWDVQVCVDTPQPIGSMTIRHTCAEGGSYDAILPVQPTFIFTRQGATVTYRPPLTMHFVSSGDWTHSDIGLFGLIELTGVTDVDSDCDGTPDRRLCFDAAGCLSDFFPGQLLSGCGSCSGPPPSAQKPLTPEQARYAAHGVFVANRNKPDVVGACCKLGEGCFLSPPQALGGCPNGIYLGDGTTCGPPDPCIQPGGPVCGNGICEPPFEDPCNCPQDCGAPPPENCTNNLDDDCDGLVDCDDPDCANECFFWKDYNGDVSGGYMPDYDQNKDYGGTGVADGAYCGPTAMGNSIWWFHHKFQTKGVVPAGMTKFDLIQDLAERMATNNQTVSPNGHGSGAPGSYVGTFVDDMQIGIDRYLTDNGLTDLLYEHTEFQPTFEFIATEVQRSQDVVLLLGFWHIEDVFKNADGEYVVSWRRIGGHYVTVAGVDKNMDRIAISDPDADAAEHGADGVVRPKGGADHDHDGDVDPLTTLPFRAVSPFPYDHLVHNDKGFASHDIYELRQSISPGGVEALINDVGPFNYAGRLGDENSMVSVHTGDAGGTSDLIITTVTPDQLEFSRFPIPVPCQVYTEIEAAVVVSPVEACCVRVEGAAPTCFEVRTAVDMQSCTDLGGDPQGPQTDCSDNNNNGIADICEFCGDFGCKSPEDQCNCPDDCGDPPSTETDCTDGVDNDCDGAIDCDDPDCSPCCGDGTCDADEDECNCPDDCGNPLASESGLCTDGVDNDCDGDIDCADSDCAGDPACGKCAPPGDDCFTTVCGSSQYDFNATPIPADFFGAGSDLINGVIQLQGASGGSDTIVRRLQQMCFDDTQLPDTQQIPIELTQLNLIGCAPLSVTYNGGNNKELWDIFVSLTGPQAQGTLTATKTHPNGGIYTANLPVSAQFTFVRRIDGFTPGPLPAPAIVLSTVCASTWLQDCAACDRGCNSTGFFPGWDTDSNGDCCRETCHAGPAPGHEHCTVPPDCRPCKQSTTETDCNNGIDDDGDGLCDCADPDCETLPKCAGEYENWVIADDFCIECQCDCDVNRDGVCDFDDISRVVDCFTDPTLPGCDQADLDCDGDIDFDDINISVCLFQGQADCCPDASRGIDRVRWFGSYLDQCTGCKCDVDKDPDGRCDPDDLAFVVDCVNNPGNPGCDNADVNCDGQFDQADIDAVACLLAGDPESKCCTPVVDSWLIALHRDIPAKACPPAQTGTFPVDLCGKVFTCISDASVQVFQPSGSAVFYELVGSIAPFNLGDELRLCGHIVPNVPRSCGGTIDLIVVDAVDACEAKHSRPSSLVAQWVFPNDVVTRVQTGKAGWDGHRIFSYTVDLPDGCLQHNFFREGEYDAATGVFFPRSKLTYWISIQAAIGHTVVFDDAQQTWIEVNTGRTVEREFWGWHTTPHGYQHKDDAYMGRLTMSCEDPMLWKYDWMSPLHCSDDQFRECCDDPTKSIDMAFYLLRTRRECVGGSLSGQPCSIDADCNLAGTTGATCVDREKIEWCQPVNPLRGTLVPTPIPTPGGLDEFPDTSVEVVINIPKLFSGTVVLTGPTVIARTNLLGVEEPDFGAVAGDAFQDVSVDDLGRLRNRARKVNPVNRSLIRDVFAANTSPTFSTEILSMDLSGFDETLGNVRLIVSNIGSSGQDGVRRQSHGEVRVTPLGSSGQDGVRHHATFDVFFEIEVDNTAAGTGLAFVSDGPLRLEADLFEIPPTEVWFKSVEGTSVGLLDRDTLQPIDGASIKQVTHCVPTQPKGGVNIHSDVDWKTAPTVDCCEPDPGSVTGCTEVDCPSADLECRPSAGFTDVDGNNVVTECDCVQISPPGCHWEDQAGVTVCEGDCPDGTACKITTVVNPDGTTDTNCGCDKIEKQACCLFDGTCIEVTTGDECCDLGGTPQGPGTDCLNTVCPLPWPIAVGANWDIHMDIPGQVANDFHIEGIVKSNCPPVLTTHIDGLFPNFTHTFTPLGGDMYEFKADWSGIEYTFCNILHLGLKFEVCCRNVMIDLIGWWTFDGARIGGVVAGGTVAADSNDGYWPFIGFDVQDCIPPPPGQSGCEQRVRFRNDSGRGRSIPVEILQMELVSVDPANLPPFEELCDLKPDGSPCAQHELPWVNVVDPAGNVITEFNPVQMLAGDEIIVLLRPATGTTADITHTLAALIDLRPAEFLLVRGLMRFTGNAGGEAAGTGEEFRWFFDIHEAHHLPEPEACCFDGAPCQDLIRQECFCAGGTPQGLGTDCSQPGICQDVCEPTADKTSCTNVLCPDLATDPKKCQTKCVVFDPLTGTSEVSQCECIGPDDCHVKVPPAGSAGVVAGPGGNPCVVTDVGGTVELPPQGCDYLSPDEVHEILDGLPIGTTIEFAAIHKDFICGDRNEGADCPAPGICEDISTGVDCFESVLEFNLVGTGDLGGLVKRTVSVSALCEVHTGPRVPGDPVQSFDTEMVALQGEIFGDPDFCTLKIVAGSAFGLPSPGHTTLTQLPSGDWSVDSFFDVFYKIDFDATGVACQNSKLAGLSGSTTGKIRMQTGNHPECEGSCAADEICVQTQVVNSDGTIEICCDCQPAPVCEPTDDGLGCEDTLCPSSNEQCVPQKVSCEGGTCRVIECKCQDPDVCHIELVDVGGAAPKVSCTGGCPPKRYCARLPIDTDNNGSKDGFECVCRGKPKAILVPAGLKGASRSFGIEHEDIGVVAGTEVVNEAIRVKLVQLYDVGVCPPRTTQPNLSLFDGEYRWFGPPAAFADNSLFAPEFVASELRCNATFRDWSEAAVSLDFPGANASVVHGYGAAVVPCSTFEVQVVEEYCADLSDESCYSEAVQFTTGLWGDLWKEFGNISFTDIGKMVEAFKGIAYIPETEKTEEDGAPPEIRAMLRGNVPPYAGKINFTDIGKVVDAFKTIAYREFGPGEEICDDGIDNDCDGTIDADGSTCVGCGAGANCECSAGSCEDP